MAEYEVQLRRYKQHKPNGDRALTGTLCYRYEVRLAESYGSSEDMVLAEFDEFDKFNCHINTEHAANDAKKYAAKLADLLGVMRPEVVTYVEKTITTKVWEPE